jgi:Zn-dependent protease with chaperone function
MGSSVVAFAVVLLPGIAAWWTGRRLIPLRDDPALPERLMARRTRLAQAAGVCWAGQLFLPGGALWMLAPGLLALLTGSFASRRALFDESWGLLPYLAWVLRLGVASGGFWTLLATAPSIVEWSGGSWPTIAALAAVLFAWSFWFAAIFRALIGARRLDRSDLQPAFEEILARSRAKAPGLYRAGPRGGRWVSALALPSVRGSAVLMSDTLLDLFDRDEIAAIFAHEVAHLEHYDGRRCLFMLLSQWLIVLLGVVAAPVVIHSIDLGLRSWIPGIWFFLIWLTLSMRVSRHQAHEAESDRRAVELCGDGSALARALTKLHALTRLPRRWPLEMERTASHPSLARRIQAIEAAAGIASSPLAAPVVVAGRAPDRFVMLGPERIEWLDGVPPETPHETAIVREAAASARTLRYGELISLRVATAGAGGALALVAIERDGTMHSLPLREEDVGRVQAALDRVDARLTRGRRGSVHHGFIASALSVCLLVVTVFSAHVATLMLPGVIAAFRQNPAALVALGVTASAQAGLWFAGLIEPPAWAAWAPAFAPSAPRSETGLAWLVIAILGVCALLLGVARAREAPETRRVGIALTAGVLGALGLLAWLAVIVSALPGPVTARLHDGARAMPSAALALWGCAAALLLVPLPRARAGAIALAILGAIPVLVGSGVFADRVVGDPLRVANRSLTSEARDAGTASQIQLDKIATGLRVSPSGSRFALQPWAGREEEDDVDDQEPARAPMLVGDFSGSSRPIEGDDLGFLDEERALVLASTSKTAELKILDVTESSSSLWRVVLPPVANPRLSVDASAGTWIVAGVDRQWSHAIGLSGRVGEDAFATRRWPLPRSRGAVQPPGSVAYAPGSDAAVVSTISVPGASARGMAGLTGPWLAFLPVSPMQWELWRLAPEGPRRLAASRGPLSCLTTPVDQATVLCWSVQRGATLLWRVTPSSGAVEPVGSLPFWGRNPQIGPDGRLAFLSPEGAVLLVDLSSRALTRVTLAGAALRAFTVMPAGGKIIALSRRPQGSTVTAYELGRVTASGPR